jgi:predicted ATPase
LVLIYIDIENDKIERLIGENMSDYADFVESYGYEVGDPDAFDKISSKWENDERDSNLKAKYEEGLAKGKSSPKKNYHNSKIKRFGFNNFKPYGEKVQSFSKKPITLIYGPNSIGKSSFIHINAYNNFIHKTQNFNLENTNMFGDEINLGGFSKFIHKRNKNNILKLEYEFEDCSEAIIDFLGLSSYGQFELDALSKFSIQDIEEIIKKSKYYTTEILSGLNQESMFGMSTQRTENEIENLKRKRKKNNLCLYVYPNESNFLRYIDDKEINSERLIDIFYKTVPYIHSSDFEEDDFDTIEYVDINLSDKKQSINLKNIDEKNYFISDVLIPYFINEAKLQYILENSSLYRFIYKQTELDSEAIKKIAEITSTFITQLLEKSEVFFKLKESPISLKIISEINYIIRPAQMGELSIASVSYYLNGQLFDKLTYQDRLDGEGLKVYGQRNCIGTMESGMFDKFETVVPDIFNNLPNFIKNKIYLDDERKHFGVNSFKVHINSLHEDKTSLLFLSYKMGYNDLVGAFNDMLGFNDMQYIGPLRFYPERDSSFKELDSDESIIPDSQTSWSYLKKDEKLRKNINMWLKDPNKLKTPYEIKYRKLYDLSKFLDEVENLSFDEILNKYLNTYQENTPSVDFSWDDDTWIIQDGYYKEKDKNLMFSAILKKIMKLSDNKEELVFEDLRNGTQISNRDLGLGISQILPVLIATNHQKNTTIAIEQPELHLHPAVQCEIADEFIRSYKENKNEFLIETHSEHLLLRIMKRMRWQSENKEDRDKSLDITPDDVCLIYVDTNGETTYLNELELDEDGSLLDPWPNGFFEEGHKERFD